MLLTAFFERITHTLYSSNHVQNYFGIVLYLFLAMALCGLLATLAYLFSLSAAQDSEKRSEYECGFEPFDSATRLPFDVHFYLVGILFLIFDVEIALLFPWVLGLRTTGWFGFYLMLGFILLLAIGFLYEWKRGALIWPSRLQEQAYVAADASMIWVWMIAGWIHENNGLIPSVDAVAEVVMPIVEEIGKSNPGIGLFCSRLKSVPATAYVNVPTARVEKKIEEAFKNLAKRIKITNLKINTWRFKTVSDHINAVRFFAHRLPLHKKSINLYLRRIAGIAGQMRSKHFYDESAITKFENRSYEFATVATSEYVKASNKYNLLLSKLEVYKNKLKLGKKCSKIISAVNEYTKARHIAKSRISKKNRLAIKQASKVLANLTRKRKIVRRRKAASRVSILLPLPVSVGMDSYAFQFLGDFLPEMTTVIILMTILTFTAIKLGQGYLKKELALESLDAVSLGFAIMIGLHVLQLFYSNAVSLFNGYIIVTSYAALIKLLTAIVGLFILSNSAKYVYEHTRHLLEYAIVILLAVLFMVMLVESGHLISAFLALVGFSLNLYVLVLFDAASAIAREAGIKYFYLSTVSSGLILYSTFLVFMLVTSGHVYDIGHFLAIDTWLLIIIAFTLQIALTKLFTGLFFKLSAFPGHLWAAEVYEGSPDPITAFFMLPVKIAVLGFVIQLVAVAFEPVVALWQPLVALSAAASLIWGCLAALAEPKTKRFLAYASINQIGFLLIGLAAASIEGYRTTIFYLVLYALMNVGFLLIFLNARRSDGNSLLYLTDFRGFGQRYIRYSWAIAMVLLSMAGIPPLAGFFGKYYLLLHAQEQELYGLVIVGLASSLVSTYYYLRLIKIMWFEGREGMTDVSCALNWRQALTLRLCEIALWIFAIHSGALTYALSTVVDSMILLNDFCNNCEVLAGLGLLVLQKSTACKTISNVFQMYAKRLCNLITYTFCTLRSNTVTPATSIILMIPNPAANFIKPMGGAAAGMPVPVEWQLAFFGISAVIIGGVVVYNYASAWWLKTQCVKMVETHQSPFKDSPAYQKILELAKEGKFKSYAEVEKTLTQTDANEAFEALKRAVQEKHNGRATKLNFRDEITNYDYKEAFGEERMEAVRNIVYKKFNECKWKEPEPIVRTFWELVDVMKNGEAVSFIELQNAIPANVAYYSSWILLVISTVILARWVGPRLYAWDTWCEYSWKYMSKLPPHFWPNPPNLPKLSVTVPELFAMGFFWYCINFMELNLAIKIFLVCAFLVTDLYLRLMIRRRKNRFDYAREERNEAIAKRKENEKKPSVLPLPLMATTHEQSATICDALINYLNPDAVSTITENEMLIINTVFLALSCLLVAAGLFLVLQQVEARKKQRSNPPM